MSRARHEERKIGDSRFRERDTSNNIKKSSKDYKCALWGGGRATEEKEGSSRLPHLLQERVGAAHEPLGLLHFQRHVGDALHASDTCHRGTHGAAAAEEPALTLEDEAAQPARGRVLRGIYLDTYSRSTERNNSIDQRRASFMWGWGLGGEATLDWVSAFAGWRRGSDTSSKFTPPRADTTGKPGWCYRRRRFIRSAWARLLIITSHHALNITSTWKAVYS